MEKRLEGQQNMALGFIDLEKTYDTVPQDIAMATLRWMGVPEAEVRIVEGTYEETTGRVVHAPGISEEFRVDVCLRQGSVLSTVIHCSSGGDQQENEHEGHSPQVVIHR